MNFSLSHFFIRKKKVHTKQVISFFFLVIERTIFAIHEAHQGTDLQPETALHSNVLQNANGTINQQL